MRLILLVFAVVFLSNGKAGAQTIFNRFLPKKSRTFLGQLFDNTIHTNTGGYAFTEGTGNNTYLAVMDSNFQVLWARSVTIKNNKSTGISIAQSALDSSYLVAGATSDPARPEYDFFISRFSKNGTLLNTYTYLYGTSSGNPMKLIALPNGRFLLGASNGNVLSGLIDLDAAGRPQTAHSLSYNNAYLLFQDLIHLREGGYLMTGNVLYNIGDGQRDIFCTKYDEQLNVVWTKLYRSGNEQEVNGMIETNDNGFFIFGYDINGARARARTFKIDSSGNVQWNKTGHLSDNFFPNSAVQCADSGYAMAGSNPFKLNKNGDLDWVSSQSNYGFTNPIIKTADEGLVSFSEPTANAALLISKLDSAGISCNSYFPNTYTPESDSLSVENRTFTSLLSNVALIDSGATALPEDSVEITSCELGVLPLSVTSFSAAHDGRYNLLNWTTANEENLRSFEVQRSSDGVSFITLSSITALSYNSHNYTFTDLSPAKGKNIYRLKMLDNKGSFIYSDTRLLQNTGSLITSILSNPVRNIVTLIITSEQAADVKIQLTNMQGVIQKTMSLKVAAGSFTTRVNVSGLSPGLYLVTTTSASQRNVLKFIKQ